jgi:glycosyltransferase involved in cell wall biosynthesis
VLLGKALGRVRAPIEGLRIRRWQPDLVYANSVWSLPLVRSLGLANRPILLHVHESSVALGGFEASHPGLIASLPTRYIAVSETVARELREHYHVPAASLAIVPPPLNSPGEGLPPRKTERAPLVVGGMGAPGWTKGVDLWLLAARRVLGLLGEQEVRFRWIGIRDDEEGRRFRAMADKLGLLQFVDFVPETDDPLAELAAIDILAMASWEEAASLVVIEAMAIGTPVVCFRGSGGPPEEIGGAGVVVDSFCPEDMADAIADLAHRPEERTRLAGEARSRADAQYGPANIMPRLVRELLTAIDAPSRSAR